MNREQIKHHFNTLDRKRFLEEPFKPQSEDDIPLPIGHGQTISQPSLVLEMTLLLEPNERCRILEIGTGSGYQTAMLSPFAKEIYTVERIPELSARARHTLTMFGFLNIHFKISDGSLGWHEEAPFDRIIVTAAASEIPSELLDQLALGGKMLIPVGLPYHQRLTVITKTLDGEILIDDAGGVVFVELVGKYGWKT